jgi:RNA polymerase sigma factor (sigma-70 family)
VWIAAFEKLDTFDPQKGTFVTWLYAITRHFVISTVRGNAISRRTISGSLMPSELSDDGTRTDFFNAFEDAAYSAYAKERKKEAVADAVNDLLTRLLPDDQREVLVLTMYGCDVPTGAALTGMSKRTFKRRRQSAMATLRRDQAVPLPTPVKGPSINWHDIQMMVA